MKIKIFKILGVLVTAVTLISVAVVGIPVSAQQVVVNSPWTKASIPTLDNNVLAGYAWLGPMALAKDGTIYAATSGGLGEAASDKSGKSDVDAFFGGSPLLKSTDGGHTWTQLTGIDRRPLEPPTSTETSTTTTTTTTFLDDRVGTPVLQQHPVATITGPGIFDVVCSPLDANIVYFTDGINIFKSVDAGTTFSTVVNLFTTLGLTPVTDGFICSIDVGYVGTQAYIFAGVSSFGLGAGGAYVSQETVSNSPWNNLNIDTDRAAPWTGGDDVYKIKADPAFATTQMVMALVSSYSTANTVRLSVKYGAYKWAANVSDVTLYTAADVSLLNASIFLPSDFSSAVASGNMNCFVGIAPKITTTPTLGGVFLAYFGPASSNSTAFKLGINGDDGFVVTSLAGTGTFGACKLLASGFLPTDPFTPQVFGSKDSGVTWTLNAKRPAGLVSIFYVIVTGQPAAVSYLLMMPDYTTSGRALIATAGPLGGISVTLDFGNTWNGYSLLAAPIFGIQDLAFAGSKIFMTTLGPISGVWRFDGTYWELVFSSALDTDLAGPLLVRASPAGDAIYVFQDEGNLVWRSTDNGQTWKKLNPLPTPVESVAVTGPFSLTIGGINTIYQTTNGVVWMPRPCPIGTITDVRAASNGDLLAVGVRGSGETKVARTTNGGVTWTVNTVPVYNSNIELAYVAPAPDYATSGKVFVTADFLADNGIWSWTYGTSTSWTRVDVTGAKVGGGVGLITSPGGPGSVDEGTGMVYATDGVSPSEVVRIRGNMTVGESLPAPTAITFKGLWLSPDATPGNTKLWTVGVDNDTPENFLYTYTDTLDVAGSGVAVSALTPSTATVNWNALSGATDYAIFVNTTQQTNLYTAANALGADGTPIKIAHATGALSAKLSNLISNTTYFVSVWVNAPLSSFMFSSAPSVTTALLPPISPMNLVPVLGASNVPVSPNFDWKTVSGATSYTLQITAASDTAFANPVFNSATVPAVTGPTVSFSYTGTLTNNTSYIWRVKANGVTGSDWVYGNFTTIPAVTPPVVVTQAPAPSIVLPTAPPPVTITVAAPAPTPVLTLPQPTISLQQPVAQTPTYIWIIVGVGALLTLAVIILIVRTRRVV